MAYPILGTPVPTFLDSSGDPLTSGTITTQNPSDSAVKNSYPTANDADLDQNASSGDITLDSRGEPTSTQYWGKDNEDYKVIIKDSAAATVLTMDKIRMPGASRRSTVTLGNGDATPTIAESELFEGNTNIDAGITNFNNDVVGDVIRVFSDVVNDNVTTIKSNAAILLQDDLDFTLIQNDTLSLAMFEDQVWHEIGRSHNNRFQTLAAAKTLDEGDSGVTYFLDLAGGFTVTLPAATLGVEFDFVVKTAPTTSYIIALAAADATMFGITIDVVATLIGTVEDQFSFVNDKAVVGDRAKVISDGTNWYVTAYSAIDGGIVFAT